MDTTGFIYKKKLFFLIIFCFYFCHSISKLSLNSTVPCSKFIWSDDSWKRKYRRVKTAVTSSHTSAWNLIKQTQSNKSYGWAFFTLLRMCVWVCVCWWFLHSTTETQSVNIRMCLFCYRSAAFYLLFGIGIYIIWDIFVTV